MVKNLPANAGVIRQAGSIPGLGTSPGGGHHSPVQSSCLENTTGGGDWRIRSIGLQESDTTEAA